MTKLHPNRRFEFDAIQRSALHRAFQLEHWVA